MASVDVEKVDKFYGTTQVLFGVEVEIEDGEFVVLVGPSGCGKSTLLRMIAGLEEISAGQIQIGGRVVNNVPPKDRDIAMVFQNYALYPHMTVQNNMAFSLKLAKAPKDEIKKRVDRAAQILGLEPYLERYPRQLSGGQRQRV
ncbi:MAG: ABC transporter ATP-binding protein, partial [Geminicoccaceae bacterium]